MKFTKEEKRDIFKKILIVFISAIIIYTIFNFDEVNKILSKSLLIMRPIIFGFAIAFVANMIMIQFQKMFIFIFKKNNSVTNIISMILAFLTLLTLIIFVFSVVIPQFVNSMLSLLYQLPSLIQTSIYSLQQSKWFERVAVNIEKFTQSIQVENLVNRGIEIIRTQGSYVFNGTISIVSTIFSSFFEAFLAISLSVYILSGKENLIKNSKKISYSIFPEKFADEISKTLKILYKNFYNFFIGQSMEALFLGTMTFIGVTLIDGPYALMLAVTAGLLNLIPYVGALTGAIISTLLLAITDPTKGLIFLIYIVIVQQIDGNYIYPNLVGSKMGIPPFWILIAITLGGAIMGPVGMVIFVPLIATVYELTREFTRNRLSEKEIDIDKK